MTIKMNKTVENILNTAGDLGLTVDEITVKNIPGFLIYRSPYEDIVTVLVARTPRSVAVTCRVRRMDETIGNIIPTRDVFAVLADL